MRAACPSQVPGNMTCPIEGACARPEALTRPLRRMVMRAGPTMAALIAAPTAEAEDKRIAPPGRGHRPCHSVPLTLGPPGVAQSPRPAPPCPRRAPAPPPPGASSPPGRALACRWCGLHGSWGKRRARAGEPHAFPVPARRGDPFPRIGKIFPAGGRPDCFFSTLLDHDDHWWNHRSAVLWRADVGVTGCKPKTRGENLSGRRAASLETARPED